MVPTVLSRSTGFSSVLQTGLVKGLWEWRFVDKSSRMDCLTMQTWKVSSTAGKWPYSASADQNGFVARRHEKGCKSIFSSYKCFCLNNKNWHLKLNHFLNLYKMKLMVQVSKKYWLLDESRHESFFRPRWSSKPPAVFKRSPMSSTSMNFGIL